MKTIADLTVHLAQKQPEIINIMLESNPIVESMPVRAATHGFKNVYAKVTDVTGPEEVQRDEELPTVSISTELGETTLGKIGGKLPIPQDSARAMGGYNKFVNDRIPTIVTKGTNRNEQIIYYQGFLATAIRNGHYTSCGGTTANSQFSMVFVHYDLASTVGLYNGNTLTTGKMFEQKFLDGGNETEIRVLDANGKERWCIGKNYVVQMEFGVQLADPNNVAALVNIQPAEDSGDKYKITGVPSAKEIDDKLADVRATTGSTFIYCHPVLQGYIASKYNLEKRSVRDGATGVHYRCYDWNGIPIIGSYNVLRGTEAVI